MVDVMSERGSEKVIVQQECPEWELARLAAGLLAS